MIPSKTINGAAKSAVKAQIDENLRRAYDEVLTEAVPDRFTQLLAQLKARDPAADERAPGEMDSQEAGK